MLVVREDPERLLNEVAYVGAHGRQKTVMCLAPVDAQCFHCGGPFGHNVLIEWHGQGVDGGILLHPACAADFAIRLLRDVHEIECLEGTALGMRSESEAQQ